MTEVTNPQIALAVVQTLDPPGIGGIDLKECLLLQLRRDKQSYPVETRIIENHLDDLANNRLPKIAKALEVNGWPVVLADSAERSDEIDIERARAAMKRAEERLKKAADIDFARAESAVGAGHGDDAPVEQRRTVARTAVVD